MCVQWRDKHDVRMLSSCIPDENVSVIRRGKEVIPLIINTCNNMMGGVYVIDQMMNLYPVDRKRFKKWYKKKCGFILPILVYSMLIYYTRG